MSLSQTAVRYAALLLSRRRAPTLLRLATGAALSLALAACGGTSTSSTSAAKYQVSVTLTGLSTGASVVLQDNTVDPLTLTQNGTFPFATQLLAGATYNVTVQTQPSGETCRVSTGSGTMSSNATTVGVSCGAPSGSVVDSFGAAPDGISPLAGLVQDSSGNLYGTTNNGGTSGNGTVFKITPAGTKSVVYSFGAAPDGVNPQASLVLDGSGNLYGTTFAGGTNGFGTVFKITPAGTESIVYSFGAPPDGVYPQTSLVLDSSGNLYGTTSSGGTTGTGNGTVFKITPAGTESVVYSFGAPPDGATPSSLVLDSSGNLYGTTSGGGTSGNGMVFKITPAGAESVVYSFGAGTDGVSPLASLVLDSSGNLYGTTSSGGTNGNGTVFKITPAGAESVVYSFGTGTDGVDPSASLVLDSSGNLYGTTYAGGTSNNGTVFKITPAGTESVVYSFGAAPDGANPQASLVLNSSGDLYGTTSIGGTSGNGTVFKITYP